WRTRFRDPVVAGTWRVEDREAAWRVNGLDHGRIVPVGLVAAVAIVGTQLEDRATGDPVVVDRRCPLIVDLHRDEGWVAGWRGRPGRCWRRCRRRRGSRCCRRRRRG